MATLVGITPVPYIYEESSDYSAVILDSRERQPNEIAIAARLPTLVGPVAENHPVATFDKPLTGLRSGSYLLDYYYRTHINPSVINVGNLLSTQVRQIEVWNANFEENELSAIDETATGGITLDGGPVPPTTYAPLQAVVYDVSISTAGPSKIDAAFEFNFSLEDYKPTLKVVGLRILLWWLPPNWVNGMTERWEWLTNVITSKNRKEQRVKLRGRPRRKFEYAAAILNDNQRRLAENLLFAWQGRSYGLPIWTDVESLTDTIPQGTTVIPCATASRDYRAGGLLAILDGSDFEIGGIDEVFANYVTLTLPLLREWKTGAKVAPLRVARISDKQKITRLTNSAATLTVQFDLIDGDDNTPMVESATYRTYSVMEVRPNWRDEISSEYLRDIEMIDFLTGATLADDVSGVQTIIHTYHWQATSRTEINALRSFLFARYGKLVPIWVPTFLNDFVLTALVAPSSSVMNVEYCEYSRNIAQAVQRRDIRIELKTGQKIYRRILSSNEVGAGEQLVLDAVVGVELTPQNIRAISFMSLCRLDADSIEMAWKTVSAAEVSAAIRTLRDDV